MCTRPLTDTRPKSLLPLGEATLLKRTMATSRAVPDRFIVVVGYRGEEVEAALGDAFEGIPIEFVTQAEPAGTADAVGQVAELVSERFLVLNGDLVFDASVVDEMADASASAIAVRSVDDPSQYGVVDVDGEVVTGIVEKPEDPPSDLVNAGLYAFEPAVFEAIDRVEPSPRGEYEL
ncbi:MAG: sugar phosphate nucleotidyltransferase, partial [archaeon]